MARIAGRKIAVLATDGVEPVELTEPVRALQQAKADVLVIAPRAGQIQGMNHHEKGDKLNVDQELASVSPDRFDALLLPGGVANPDALRVDPKAIAFVRPAGLLPRNAGPARRIRAPDRLIMRGVCAAGGRQVKASR